jgi:hypothetical protein
MSQTTTSDRSTDTQQTVTIPVIPPRDPESYRITSHFRNRLRQRVPDAFRPSLPANLIRDGRILRLETDAETQSHGAVVAFTTTGPKQRPWTLIAGLRAEAFNSADEHHRVVTIFQGTPNREKVVSS